MSETQFDSESRPMVASELPAASLTSQLAPTIPGLLVAESTVPTGCVDANLSQNLARSSQSDMDGSVKQKLPVMDEQQRLVLTERLLNEHHDLVYRYAHHLLGCRTTAEDIVQEVFLRALCRVHQLRSLDAAGAWLLAITRNEAARWCNKWTSIQSNDIELVSEGHHERRVEDHEWIHHSIQQLPIEFRRVVLMYYFEQKSYAEIAELLELPIGTVMSRLNRARGHLKEALAALTESSTVSKASAMIEKEAAK